MPVDFASSQLHYLASAVRDGTVTARTLVDESLRRIEARSELGAVITTRPADARTEADAVDAALGRETNKSVLAGIPVLVKDNTHVRGMTTTFGSVLYANSKPAKQDSLVVARLRRAGAIIVGKSNIPEFCIEGLFTDNLIFGPSRNPWCLEHSPGGSSGGSAAAISGGLVPAATGADGGGSVRIPAALCGLVGYKPTNGVIGQVIPPPWIDFSTDGILATSVDDASVLLEVLKGPVNGDPTALPGSLPLPTKPKRLIVAERTDDLGPLPDDVSRAFKGAVKRLAELLHLPIEHWAPGSFFETWKPDEDWFVIAATEHVNALGREFVTRELSRLHPGTREFFEFGRSVSADHYLSARRRRFEAIARMDHILQDGVILLTPAVAISSFAPEGQQKSIPVGLTSAKHYSTAIQNMTGLPAISLPAAPISSDTPFGLQLTMSRWADLSLLDVARRWECAFPWPRTAPNYSEFSWPDTTRRPPRSK